MWIVEIERFRVDPGAAARLLVLRGPALAEFRARVPELRQADLVRVGDDVWLDIRTWGKAVDPALVEAAARGPLYGELRALLGAPLAHDRGERLHTTGTAWAAGR